MKKIPLILMLLSSALFSKLLIGEKIPLFEVHNQFEKLHKIEKKTLKIVFVFQKETAHSVKTFLDSKDIDYLSSKNTLVVVDISKMSSISRWFILDEFEEQGYNVLFIKDEKMSKKYLDEKSIDKIMIVGLDNFKIIGIDYIKEIEELQNLIENN